MHDSAEEDWMAAMRRGDFERAWTISDRILANRLAHNDFDQTLPRHLQTIWQGRSLVGKHVLVRCYHGLGDTIQFIRFAKPLRSIAREVSVWAQAPLAPLIARVEGVDRVLPLHDGIPDLAYDADIEIMELAHALRATSVTLATDVPYVRAPARDLRGTASGRLRVGLVWAAGDWDPRRSMRFADLAPLLRLPEIEPIVLQRGSAREEARAYAIRDLGTDDIQAFVATLRGLDLLISVDTFAAHLAGAMALPTWTMLHSECDWRWMNEGRTSPWYPSMRLFRQSSPGDWMPVVSEIAHELAREAHLRASAERPGNKPNGVTFAPCNELTSSR